ncbi:hypothetical protein FNV43_RR07403 [Rhamnella rubrinervis]|uniref:Uncharacterized protein n=1 Tax=Rhamnella rubrinervis TaxID=2594499 RepID=A0A8K0HFT3_9ROSA|nr:hypothetical protein FNV43_RR07403 [Rhamnella rubrinervis]
MVVWAVTPRRESSSSGSYTGRRFHRGCIPSTSSEEYHDVGLDDDFAHRELEGWRQDIAMFLRGEAVMILFGEEALFTCLLGSFGTFKRIIFMICTCAFRGYRMTCSIERAAAVVKQFRDLHPMEFDGSLNPLVEENGI